MLEKKLTNQQNLVIEKPIKFQEAKEFLGINADSSLKKLLKQEKIKGHRVLSEWRFFRSELSDQIKQL